MSLTQYSTIKLYHAISGKKWLLEKDKNFAFTDGVEVYLASLGDSAYTTISQFQYIKHKLNIEIVVDLSQTYSQPLKQYGIKYISILNSEDTKTYYYFVDKAEWRSNHSVKFYLTMDTINTFKYGTDYSADNRTLIIREHKDRFETYTQHVEKVISVVAPDDDDIDIPIDSNKKVKASSIQFSNLSQGINSVVVDHIDTNAINVLIDFSIAAQDEEFTISYDYECLRRVIDLRNEELSPVLYKMNEEELDDGSGTSWSLYYKNDNTPDASKFYQINPVSCYIVPKDEVSVKIVDPAITNAIIGVRGKTFIPYFNDILYTFSFDNGVFTYTLPKYESTLITKTCESIEFRISGGNTQYRIIWYNYSNVGGIGYTKSIKKDWTTFTSCKILNTVQSFNAYSGIGYNDFTSQNVLNKNVFADFSYTFTPSSPQTLSADNIDRTDSKNIKIITLPYCPTTIDHNGSDLIFSPLWTYDNTEQKLKLNNVRTQFNATFTNDISVFGNLYVGTTPNPLSNKSEYYESKLYNSQFYQPKFVYDSFNKYFELENMNDVEDSTKFQVNFVASRNIVSKFMFSFPQYSLNRSLNDYDNVVLVGRNNEEVLYTSAYIDYIKTGFNYDNRSKERNATVGGIGLGLQVAGTVGTIAGAVASQNPIGIAMAVGMGVSLVSSIVSYTKSIIENDSNINRKLDEAKRQAVSVSSVDDVDLLTAYSNNKAKICWYEPLPEVKKAIFNLFYYCGYSRNVQGVPNVHTRCWFNFLQANLLIDDENNITEEILDDIKNKFANGITFFHKYNNTFDMDQAKENVELSLLE